MLSRASRTTEKSGCGLVYQDLPLLRQLHELLGAGIHVAQQHVEPALLRRRAANAFALLIEAYVVLPLAEPDHPRDVLLQVQQLLSC